MVSESGRQMLQQKHGRKSLFPNDADVSSSDTVTPKESRANLQPGGPRYQPKNVFYSPTVAHTPAFTHQNTENRLAGDASDTPGTFHHARTPSSRKFDSDNPSSHSARKPALAMNTGNSAPYNPGKTSAQRYNQH